MLKEAESPNRKFRTRFTRLPRVCFGKSATFKPEGSAVRVKCASTFDGDGSNDSPCKTFRRRME